MSQGDFQLPTSATQADKPPVQTKWNPASAPIEFPVQPPSLIPVQRDVTLQVGFIPPTLEKVEKPVVPALTPAPAPKVNVVIVGAPATAAPRPAPAQTELGFGSGSAPAVSNPVLPSLLVRSKDWPFPPETHIDSAATSAHPDENPNGLEVGHLVTRPNGPSLREAFHQFPVVVVANINPFVLVSPDGMARWSSNKIILAEFVKAGVADEKVMTRVMTRLRN